MAKIDLKDAYLIVAVQEMSRKFLQFLWKGVIYQYKATPFGLNIAPYVFTKLLKRLTQNPWDQNHRILGRYVPSCSQRTTSKGAFQHDDIPHTSLGFQSELGEITGIPPTNLGVPRDRSKLRRNEPTNTPIHHIQDQNPVPKTGTQGNFFSIGLLTFTKVAIPVAPLFFRALQFDLISAIRLPGGYNQKTTLSQASLANLNWWTAHTPRWNSNPIVKREIDLVIQTDASLTGWGASSHGKMASGAWSPEERTHHINLLELKAAFLA